MMQHAAVDLDQIFLVYSGNIELHKTADYAQT
jgi:hypothetical protein